MTIAMQKHHAVVEHNAAHQVGALLNATYGVLSTMTDTAMTALPDVQSEMLVQKNALTTSYVTLIDLYVNGKN